MKKSVHPGVIIAILAACIVAIILFYYKKTEPPPPIPMDPHGPAARMLKGKGLPRGTTPDMLEAQKKAQQTSGSTTGQ